MAKPSSSAYVNPTHSLASGLICAVPFIEGTGTTAMDFIDPQHPCTVTTWTTSGGVPFAQGSTRRLTRYPIFQSPPNVLTLATRFLMGPVGGSNSTFASLAPTDLSYTAAGLRQISTNAKLRTIWNNVFDVVVGTTDLVSGSVYDAAITWDGTTLKQYLNGSLDGSFTPTGNALRNLYSTFNASAFNSGGSSNPFTEYTFVWDRALSSTEVAAVASSPYQMFSEPTAGGSTFFSRGILTGGRL